MPTVYPGALDSFPTPVSSNALNQPVSHTALHVSINEAVEALEAKVGIDDSAVATSLDYLIRQGMAFVGQTIEWNSLMTDPPVGEWADEDGRPLSIAQYPVLFALLGTTWNNFRGLSSPALGFFRIPWSDGLVAVAAGGAVGGTFVPTTSARVLGQAGGAETVVLTVPELASHVHGADDPGHNHQSPDSNRFLTTDGNTIAVGTAAPTMDIPTVVDGGSKLVADNTTGVTVTSAGGDQAHQNMQPFAVKRKIIRIA